MRKKYFSMSGLLPEIENFPFLSVYLSSKIFNFKKNTRFRKPALFPSSVKKEPKLMGFSDRATLQSLGHSVTEG